MYILSQVLAVIADLIFIIAVLSKRKSKLVFILFISDVLFSIHYFILHALTGAVAILIDALFMSSAYILERCKKGRYKFVIAILAFAGLVVTGIFAYNGIVSLLPVVYMSICILGVMLNNIIFAKVGALIRNILCATYLLLINSYAGAIIETVLMVATLAGIIMWFIEKRRKSQEAK